MALHASPRNAIAAHLSRTRPRRPRHAPSGSRAAQSQERREKETLEARIDKLQGSVAKTNEQGRANLESFNGRLDEIREMLEEIAQK